MRIKLYAAITMWMTNMNFIAGFSELYSRMLENWMDQIRQRNLQKCIIQGYTFPASETILEHFDQEFKVQRTFLLAASAIFICSYVDFMIPAGCRCLYLFSC